ncbi:MAG: LysE family translocator [Marinagarivorans sp.]|nr:LysE family translocator [Marinagarivorans sp.]
MTTTTIISFIFTLLVLAAVPGLGVLAVVSRALLGFRHGLVASLGVVCGDYVFIALSLLGLSALAQSLGDLFVWIQYAGALYLVWLGVSLLRAKVVENLNNSPCISDDLPAKNIKTAAFFSSFNAGFLTTLGNPKAIVFYASFFPAFINIATLNTRDLAIILISVFMAVGGVMASYAFAASRSRHWFLSAPMSGNDAPKKATQILNRVAGGIMVVCGLWLVLGLGVRVF